MFGLRDSWVWDFWVVDDGGTYHLFFLFASRALGDPQARHVRAAVGHAVSSDLVSWARVEDALVHGEPGDFDDLATWTGSVVSDPRGGWVMLYTGAQRTDGVPAQTIGAARSDDLMSWTKVTGRALLVPDPTVYETYDGTHSNAFRDPWVFADEGGDGWHLLCTARSLTGPVAGRGVLGHAWSPDLALWELRAPLPGQGGFPFLEVPQIAQVGDVWVLLFSCPADEAPQAPTVPGGGDVWSVVGAGPLGPFDLRRARQLGLGSGYGARLVRLRGTDNWVVLTFDRDPTTATFAQISDPRPFRPRTHYVAR